MQRAVTTCVTFADDTQMAAGPALALQDQGHPVEPDVDLIAQRFGEGFGLGLAGHRPGSGAWERFPVVAFDVSGGEVRGEVLSVPRTGSVQIQFRGEVVATGAHPMSDAPIVA